MELAADKVRRMHDAGIVHGHLLPGHLLVTDDQADVVFIDNDENRLLGSSAPWSCRSANLVQLAHQVLPFYSSWRTFFYHYFQGLGLPREVWRRRLASILHAARARRAGNRREPRQTPSERHM
jgi:hypothetical protein